MSNKVYLLVSELDKDNIGVLELDSDNVNDNAITPKLTTAFLEEHGFEDDDVAVKEIELEGHHPYRFRVTMMVGNNEEYLLFLNQTWIY